MAKNSLKRRFFSIALLLTLSLAGCGKNPQPVTGGEGSGAGSVANGEETDATQGNGEIYYIMEETALPDPD
ncbi:MAG: hypothetical protein K2G20_06590, partial [Lachnospiraceae bacterium]|nr:hypothetical protein [Lachnospiraceae bacterium]